MECHWSIAAMLLGAEMNSSIIGISSIISMAGVGQDYA
jgi:hypothetical protein